MRMPIIRSNLAAIADLEVRSFWAQATADVLSQKMPMCLYFKHIGNVSKSSQFSVAPANSRSFIVMVPVLLVEVTRLFCMSCGHSNCHSIGSMGDVPLVQIPPAPILHASL